MPRERVVDVLGASTISGGRRRTRLRAGRVEHEPLLEQRAAARGPARRRRCRTATIRPRPRTFDARRAARASAVAQPLAQLAHAREQRRVVEHVERGVRGRGDERAAGERRAVVAGREARRRAARR